MGIKSAFRRWEANGVWRKIGACCVGFAFGVSYFLVVQKVLPSLRFQPPLALHIFLGLVVAGAAGFAVGHIAKEKGSHLGLWSIYLPFRILSESVFNATTLPWLEILFLMCSLLSAGLGGALGEKFARKEPGKSLLKRIDPQPIVAVFMVFAWLVGVIGLPIYAATADFGAKWAIQTNGVAPLFVQGNNGRTYLAENDSESSVLQAFDSDGRWTWDFRMDGYDEIADCIVSVGGTIYVSALSHQDNSTTKGMLYALKPNGSVKWKSALKSRGIPTLAVGNDGTVYAASGAALAFSPNGVKKWEISLEETATIAPKLGKDGSLYVTTSPSGPQDREAGTGKLQGESQKREAPGYLYKIRADGTVAWKVPLEGIPVFAPQVAGKVIYAVLCSETETQSQGSGEARSGSQRLIAINEDGTICWSKEYVALVGPPVTDRHGAVYFASKDGRLHALRADGSTKWMFAVNGALTRPLIGGNETLYVASGSSTDSSSHGCIYALSPDGDELWRRAVGNRTFTSLYGGGNGVAYASCYSRAEPGKTMLYAIDVSR